MLYELFNSLSNTIIEVNVIKGEAYNRVKELIDMFNSGEKIELNENEFYNNVWFMVKSKDAKCVKKMLSKLDGVISYK